MTGIFTLDSIMAFAIAFWIITASMYMISTPKISLEEYLYQFSSDVLAIAEKGDFLKKAVNGDPSGMEELKMSLPDNICFDLEIVNESSILIFHDYQAGCPTIPEKYSQAKRTLVSNASFYISTLKAWYK
jgi:hypothetical protein